MIECIHVFIFVGLALGSTESVECAVAVIEVASISGSIPHHWQFIIIPPAFMSSHVDMFSPSGRRLVLDRALIKADRLGRYNPISCKFALWSGGVGPLNSQNEKLSVQYSDDSQSN
jgi:hypothetical protein